MRWTGQRGRDDLLYEVFKKSMSGIRTRKFHFLYDIYYTYSKYSLLLKCIYER